MTPSRPRLALAGAALLALAAAAPGPRPLLLNESPSLPRGLYALAPGPVAVGSVVAVVPPAGARPYLAGLGAPADARLLKRVAGAGGDLACAAGGAVVVRGRRAPVLTADRRGRRLPAWRGCRRLGPDELFLLGDTPASFDSRYFGPVRRKAAHGPYREVLTW